MSFINKTLSSFGIGSVKVDSVLRQDVIFPGKKANITIHLYGGSERQEIENIHLRLCCRYIKEALDESSDELKRAHEHYTLLTWDLPYSFAISPRETRDFDVELDIPWNTPITIGDTKVWIQTDVDIAKAPDPTDKDILTVRPDPLMDGIFSALENKGLRIRQVECEAVEGFPLPYVQEFEFVPIDGPYHGCWRELELVCHYSDEDVQMWFEIDRNRKGTKGMLASLLSEGKLTHHLSIPLSASAEQAGDTVISYLEETYL
ncbi:sporulation protein [Vibrio marisflavi]|uniref:Sporulation-control protein spo0M n=1 Tax=Vibrio marisflavi CECT 7928 TaxID=634439 RepID=A0ABM9A8U3_9VIBR|nr:sporulation protein [Vibrio marisflavi]CAH0541914.1 Sporulation-control protein spo0M [Vibrio marisflavi CECT 7928]